MIPLFIIYSTALITGVFVIHGNQAQVPQVVTTVPQNQGFDPSMGELTDVLNKLIYKCSNYLPMVDSYMKSQLDNAEFLSGETDVITLQVSMDTTFNACKNILNVIAAYQLVISESDD